MRPVAAFRHLGGLLRELWAFARYHRAWWIVPLVVVLLLAALFIVAGSQTLPFMYTIF